MLINVVSFTNGMFEGVKEYVSIIIEENKMLEDSKKEILVVIEVILSTAFIKEALVTFAIFDFIIREFKQNIFNKGK